MGREPEGEEGFSLAARQRPLKSAFLSGGQRRWAAPPRRPRPGSLLLRPRMFPAPSFAVGPSWLQASSFWSCQREFLGEEAQAA